MEEDNYWKRALRKRMTRRKMLLTVAQGSAGLLGATMLGCTVQPAAQSTATTAPVGQTPKANPTAGATGQTPSANPTAGAATAAETVYFGSYFALTGGAASFGQPSLNGLRLDVEEINKAGGFKVSNKTYQIKLLEADTEGKAEQAVAVVTKQLSENHPPIVFGSTISTTAAPVAEMVKTRKDFLLMGGATILATKSKESSLIFRTLPPQEWTSGDHINYAVDTLGCKSVAMIVADDEIGHIIVDSEYTPQFQRRGVKITDTLYFPVGTKDFSTFVTRVKPNKPDAIFLGYLDPDTQGIIGQALEQGVTKNFIQRGGSAIGALPYKDQIENYIYQVFVELDSSKNPNVATYKQRYKDRYGRVADSAHNDSYSLFYYGFATIVTKAMTKAGTVTDINAIAKAISEVTHEGVLGNIKFDPQRRAMMPIEGGHLRKGGAIITFPIVPKPELAPAALR